MKYSIRIPIVIWMGLVLGACTFNPRTQTETTNAIDTDVAKLHASDQLKTKTAPPLYEKIDGIYITRKTVPLTRDLTLPHLFDTRFTMRESRLVTVQELADEVQKLGVPVFINDDKASTLIVADFDASLREVLDSATQRAGAFWNYQDNAVWIARYQTRVFEVRRSGAEDRDMLTTAGTNSTSRDPWIDLVAQIKKAVSKNGEVSENRKSGTIVVTDVPAAMDRVARIIEEENRRSERMIQLSYQVISFISYSNQELGVDWNLVFQRMSNALPTGAFSFNTPQTLTSTDAGSFTLNVQGNGVLSGTKSLISAMNEYGKARVVESGTVTASQNEKASWSLEDEVTYLAKLTPSPSGGAGLGAGTPGIEPGTVKVGFEVIAIPTAFENNRVQVRLNLSISQLNKIGSVGIGTGANALQIQTPEVSRAKNSAIFTSRSNVTTVLTAFRREFNQYDRRGLTDKEEPDATSSFKGKGRAETYYLLVTPVIL